MKKTKKIVVLVLAMCLLVGASVMGTVAYLTSKTNDVTNTFTVGNVAITMDEEDVDNSTEDAERDTANKYHLLPGGEYAKDPTIHVSEGSEDCYLFVKVVNGLEKIEGANKIASQMEANGWKETSTAGIFKYIGTEEDADAAIAVVEKTNISVFNTLTIDGKIENSELAEYATDEGGNTGIIVTACAVQSTNVSADAAQGQAFALLNPQT